MKIAVIRKNYNPYGGAERYLSRLIDQLAQAGHEIHIFAKHWETGSGGKEKVILHRVPTINVFSFLEVVSFALFASAMVRKENFDIIHSFDRTLYQDVHRAGDGCHREWLIQRKKIEPWIKSLSHSLNPMHRSILLLEKHLFQSSRLKIIIANSQRGKREIIHHYQVPERKIRVIYNGVDLAHFNPETLVPYRRRVREDWGIGEKDRVLLFVGSGYGRKGLKFILSSLPRLEKNVKLIVVGKDRIGPYQSMADNLGIIDRVYFLGPQKDVERFYAAGDLFVLPSIYEPCSNACLEALACGLPVVTSKMNGASEMIQEGGNGLIIENPENPSEMVEILRKALTTWEKLDDRREIRNISRLVDLESNVKEMMQIYQDLSSPGGYLNRVPKPV